jgi:hypothetical protein
MLQARQSRIGAAARRSAEKAREWLDRYPPAVAMTVIRKLPSAD